MQKQKGYPLYFKGNRNILKHVNFKFDQTISTTQHYPVSVQFLPQFNQKIQLFQPTTYLEVFDESVRQLISKQKYALKSEFFYVYYPSDIRVDQIIYKTYLKNYQNMLDEIPRNLRMNFAKFIFWEEGKGEHSLDTQKFRINDQLSKLSKMLVQKKIASLSSEIKHYQTQAINSKALLHIFLLKNKIAKIYQFLQLTNCNIEFLQDVWNQVMINFRCMMKIKASSKINSSQRLEFPPSTMPEPPYIKTRLQDILGYFESEDVSGYLRVVTFAFFKLFSFYLQSDYYIAHYEGLKALKIFTDYIFTNVLVLSRPKEWSKQEMMKYDILRNLWNFQVLYTALLQYGEKTQIIVDQSKDAALLSSCRLLHTGICSTMRNSIEKIGFLLYELDNFSIFPKNLRYQINFLLQKIQRHDQDKKDKIIQNSSRSFIRKGLNQLLSHEKLASSQITIKLLANLPSFCQIYTDILQLMYCSLKVSTYKKVAESLKLTIKKAMLLFNIQLTLQKNKVIKMIQQCQNSLKVVKSWAQIESINDLYDITLLTTIIDEFKQTDQYQQIVKLYKNKLMKIIFNSHTNAFLLNQPQKNSILQNSSSSYFRLISSCIRKISENHKIEIGNLLKARIQSTNTNQNNQTFQIILETQLNINLDLSAHFQQNKIVQIIQVLFNKSQSTLLNCTAQNYQPTNKQTIQQNIKDIVLQKPEIFFTQNEHNRISIKSTINLQSLQKVPIIFKISALSLKFDVCKQQFNFIINANTELNNTFQYINLPEIFIQRICVDKQLQSRNNVQQIILYYDLWTPVKILIKCNQQFFSNKFKLSAIESLIEQKLIPQQSNNVDIYQIFEIKDRFILKTSEISQNQANYKYIMYQFRTLQDNNDLNYMLKQGNVELTVFIKILGNKSKLIAAETDKKLTFNFNFSFNDQESQNIKKKTYWISKSVHNIKIAPLFNIQYSSIRNFQEWKLISLTDFPLKVTTVEDQQIILNQFQHINVWNPKISIQWLNFLQQEEIDSTINLRQYQNNSEALDRQKFILSYINEPSYHILKPIQIRSEKIGIIQIIDESLSFQFVGKIQGQVKYVPNRQHQKILDLFVVPIKSGNIEMPKITIDGCLGVWDQIHLMHVQE